MKTTERLERKISIDVIEEKSCMNYMTQWSTQAFIYFMRKII